MGIEEVVSKAREHFLKGIQACKWRAFDIAEEEFRKAIELDASLADAHYHLGFLFLGLKRFEEAKKEFEEVVKLRPDAKAYGNLGILYFEAGDKEKAREALLKAKELFEKEKSYQEAKICEEYLAKLG
jgi:Flp pilus assembly protein TadD